MRVLACCFVALAVLWSALAWCAVCASTSVDGSDFSALTLDLAASVAFLGLTAIATSLWAAEFASEE